MNILIINGPNLNLLGFREPDVYGYQTYDDLLKHIKKQANDFKCKIKVVQTNHEGSIIDLLHKAPNKYDSIILNAGGYTHTSIAIRDAIKAIKICVVEVHLSNIYEREDFRKVNYMKEVVDVSFYGEYFESYTKAIKYLINKKEKKI